jgi:glyoxylase-like metal-dependent hydrolase (beta-lactamase superfamily II)
MSTRSPHAGDSSKADQEWFEVRRFPHAVTMIHEPHHSDDVNSYLVEGERDVAVLDTGFGVGDFAELVATLSSRRPRVLQTHADWDHIGASHRFDEVLVHPSEAVALRGGLSPERYRLAFFPGLVDIDRLPAGFNPGAGIPGCEPTGFLAHGDRIDLGGRVLEVFHTPGHSPGGALFLDRQARALFVGDLLYFDQMYVFFPDSDPVAFRASLRLAGELSDEIDVVYPAHGPSPLTPENVCEIRDAYETIWAGRPRDRDGELFGIAVTIHDFGRFSFLLPVTVAPG